VKLCNRRESLNNYYTFESVKYIHLVFHKKQQVPYNYEVMVLRIFVACHHTNIVYTAQGLYAYHAVLKMQSNTKYD